MSQYGICTGGCKFMQIITKSGKNGHVNRGNLVKIRYLEEEFCEKSLWKAVICQAIEDATTKSAQKRRLLIKRRALKWIEEDEEDFKAVCDLAGYNHKKVKESILEIVENG
jgi:hypothetical protein